MIVVLYYSPHYPKQVHEERSRTMAPTIRIDDEVFAHLQQLAKPFVDTPNSVLRRQLGLEELPESNGTRRRRKTAGGTRAHPDDILPGQDYYVPILEVLAEGDGVLRSRDAVAGVGQKLEGRLKPLDYEELPSGAIRWENRARWAANALKNAGLMLRRDDGMWELSQEGRESAKSGKLPENIRGAGRSRKRARGSPSATA
jgi:Mrr N-terminal domain